MVNVSFTDNGGLILHGVGHCGWGKRGKDLICAAVTTLFYTAQREAVRLEQEGKLSNAPDIYLSSGEAYIGIHPTEDAQEEARCIFHTICSGLAVIQESFPSAVCLTISETAMPCNTTEEAPA